MYQDNLKSPISQDAQDPQLPLSLRANTNLGILEFYL